MPDFVFAEDTFAQADTDGFLANGTLASDGHAWAQVHTYAGDLIANSVIPAGVHPNVGSSVAMYALGGTPPSTDYSVEGYLYMRAGIGFGTQDDYLGITARTQGNGACYALVYTWNIAPDTPFALYYISDGDRTVAVQLDVQSSFTPIANHVHHLKLTVSGTGAEVTITGVVTDLFDNSILATLSAVDTASSRIVTAGKAAIWSANISADQAFFPRLQHFIATSGVDPSPPPAPVIPGIDFDVRLYGADGKRRYFPREWVDTCEFEIAENGGMAIGTLTTLLPWETLSFTGGERIDVFVFGQILYRGWVRLPQSEIADPERKTLTLYGPMELLNGYRIGRGLWYAVNTSIEIIFEEIVNKYVKVDGRLPSLVIDVTGVNDLALTLFTLDESGKSVTEGLNDLVNVSPGSLIWGFDVDSGGNTRIYLRPRSRAVKYKYSVGGPVQAFVYPFDTTQVVNSLYVTGGDMVYPNLAPNPSFERGVAAGETTSNLLQSPSFEDADHGTIPNWGIGSGLGNPTADASYSRTGNLSLVMDDDPSSPEGVYQDVFLPALPATVYWSVYARCPAAETWHLHVKFELLDSSATVLATHTFTPILIADDEQWHRCSGSWSAPATAGAEKIRLTFNTASPDSGAHGLNIDDAALWLGDVLAESWAPGRSNLATFTTLDWQNQEIAPYDGEVVVKVVPNIVSSGGYAEIGTTAAARIATKAWHTYRFGIYVAGSVVNPPVVAIGAYGYIGNRQLFPTKVGPQVTINSGRWHLLEYDILAGANVDGVDLFVRFYNNHPAYVDAAGVFENNLPVTWYPDKSFFAHVTVEDYAGSIDSAAAASMTQYGLREKSESNALILDQQSLDAFAIGYFNAHAVPSVQARLDLFDPMSPLLLDGSVKIVGLPQAPPALFPSRVRYTVGDAITISADLGNQRPDLANLLVESAASGASSASSAGSSSGSSSGSSGSGSSGGSGGATTSLAVSGDLVGQVGDLRLLAGSGASITRIGPEFTISASGGSTYSGENKEGASISAGMAVAVHSSGTGVVKANASDNSKNAVGLMAADTADTVSGVIQTDGPFTLPDWTAVIGASALSARAVYFLDTTSGLLTTTPPASGGNVVQRIGLAVSDTTLEIEIGPSILL